MDRTKGSIIAKDGFRNEKDIVNKFVNWANDNEARQWLAAMGYFPEEIEYVTAEVLYGYKTDVQVHISIKPKNFIDVQNLQIKLVSNKSGFNQIDKRRVDNYTELWNIPEKTAKLLKYYTGEIPPYKADVRDKRRMFIDEFSTEEQEELLKWFTENKILIISDVIKGRGKFSAEWILIAQKYDSVCRWSLLPINIALNHYCSGDVKISNKGNLKLGHITMQRKGGDGGRKTANMLQFKADPAELFDIVF